MSSIKTGLIALITVLIILMAAKAFAEETYVLPKDTIVFRSDFNSKSAAVFTQQVMMSQSKRLVIYLDTPGGSVFALDGMVQAVRATKKPVFCIVKFAASAGFMFTEQACDRRIILPNGILMSHQASLQIGGEVNRLNEFLRLLTNMMDRMDREVADRVGMDLDAYRARISDEWWAGADEAIAHNLADEKALVVCTPEMAAETFTEQVSVFIFVLDVTWSRCPIISSPLAVEMASGPTDQPIPSLDSRTRFMSNKDFYTKGAFLSK